MTSPDLAQTPEMASGRPLYPSPTVAVLPIAGLGTRLWPLTQSRPKELLPLDGRPIIDFVVTEALSAGITRFILVSRNAQPQVLDYLLGDAGPQALRLAPHRLSVVVQERPLGLGHAVWCARAAVGSAPFAVLLPDDVILAQPGCLSQMTALYPRLGGNLMACMAVAAQETSAYGIITPAQAAKAQTAKTQHQTHDARLVAVANLIEKPSPGTAPSCLAVIGRFILQAEIFPALEKAAPGSGGEIQLTEAIAGLIPRSSSWGYLFTGQRFDCGQHAGLRAAGQEVARVRARL